MRANKLLRLFFRPSLTALALLPWQEPVLEFQDPFVGAAENAQLANEGFRRCQDYVDGWLLLADSHSGLIPRNTKDQYWNAQDSAADNYPFMVLTTSFTNRVMYAGRMRQMLEAEIKLTSRIDALPDTYHFAKKGFAEGEPDLNRIIFGSSEYIKDGLLPMTEWLGHSPWSQRMISILDDMWKHAPVDTPFGRIVSNNVEVNGEMLQVLSRVYWMTGDAKYLQWAQRLGDYYLLGDQHPTKNFKTLRLRDHGCEIVSGLCELYAAVHFAAPEKKKAYFKPIHEMLDRILEIGRNQHGMFYNSIDPQQGKPVGAGIADTWGYTLNGFYTVYLLDGTKAYRAATLQALSSINEHYRNYKWEGNSSDGYADSIESALNLYNREPVTSAGQWIDSEMQVMWSKQKPDGVIEGWHGDGNFARTTLMYCLWKTQGVSAHPWRRDLQFGAVEKDDTLYLTVTAEADWNGKIHFDAIRHQSVMKLPLDWPRINQFPEWFCVDPAAEYRIQQDAVGKALVFKGAQMQEGVGFSVSAGKELRLQIQKLN